MEEVFRAVPGHARHPAACDRDTWVVLLKAIMGYVQDCISPIQLTS
jgi:hypothetical protein